MSTSTGDFASTATGGGAGDYNNDPMHPIAVLGECTQQSKGGTATGTLEHPHSLDWSH